AACPHAARVLVRSAAPVTVMETPVAAVVDPVGGVVAITRSRAHPGAADPDMPMRPRVPAPVARRPRIAASRRRRTLEARRRWRHANADTHADRHLRRHRGRRIHRRGGAEAKSGQQGQFESHAVHRGSPWCAARRGTQPQERLLLRGVYRLRHVRSGLPGRCRSKRRRRNTTRITKLKHDVGVAMSSPAKHVPASAPQTETTPLRFVTAASLFDGHDAAINIMRRIIQSQGAEVIHLGHNRSVEDVVRAALQEDADAIAMSSYQGGHVEYFKYMVDMLKEKGASHIRVFGGGGGTITPEEIKELQAYGVERIYHPNDGMKLGLTEMIEDVVARAACARESGIGNRESINTTSDIDDEISIGRMLSALEDGAFSDAELTELRKGWVSGSTDSRFPIPHSRPGTPVLGLTGTGGAGKSSVVDELLLRFLHAFPDMRIAVLAVDPTRRRSGGALLGDRIRMNSLRSHRVYMRSMATRCQHAA